MAADEAQGGQSKAVQTSRAQEILQAYQQYKAGNNPSGTTPKPEAKPIPSPSGGPVKVSPQILRRSDQLRAENDLPPLETVSNVQVVPNTATKEPVGPKPEKITDTIEQQRKSNIAQSKQTLSQITKDFTDAKNAGVTSINVTDPSGKVIGTINPQNVSEARLQYLKLTGKTGGGYQYQKPGSSEVTTTLTTYSPKDPVTAFAGGFLEGGAQIGGLALGGLAQLTGKPVLGVKSIDDFNTRMEKTFGTSAFSKITGGEKVDLSSPIEIASLAGTGTFFAATAGIGFESAGSKAAGAVAKAIKTGENLPKEFQAVYEGGLTRTTKLGGTTEFEQVGIPKEGNVSPVIRLQQFLARQGRIVQTVKTKSPVPQKEVIGIGPKGEKVPTKLEPMATLTKETHQIEPEIPFSYSTKTGRVAYQKNTISQFKPQEGVFYDVDKEFVAKYGLKPTGEKGVYTGKITPQLERDLVGLEKTEQIKPTSDIFAFYKKDIIKNPKKYGQAIREPKMFTKEPSLVKPYIIRQFVGKAPGGFKEPKVTPKPTAPRQNKPMKPLKDLSSVGSTTVAGGAGRSASLLEKPEVKPASTGLKTETAKPKQAPRQIPRSTLETELVTERVLKPSGGLGTVSKLETHVIEKPVGATVSKTEKTKPIGLLITTPVEKTKETTGLTTKPKQVTGLTTKTKQITTPNENTTPHPDNVPDSTKRLGGLIPGMTIPSGALGRVSKSGARKTYTGNVPLTGIVGIYKRSEITYGTPKAPKAGKSYNITYKSLSKTRKNYKI